MRRKVKKKHEMRIFLRWRVNGRVNVDWQRIVYGIDWNRIQQYFEFES